MLPGVIAVLAGKGGSKTETLTVTVGNDTTQISSSDGWVSPSTGSISPSTLNGLDVLAVYFLSFGGDQFIVILEDTSGDPGQNFFKKVEIEADSTTFTYNTASADSYTYDPVTDQAQWAWIESSNRWADETAATRAVTFTL
jgi:hypothetical protein